MNTKTKKTKHILHLTGWSFIWQKRGTVIEKTASWLPVTMVAKYNESRFSFLLHYDYVFKADKREYLEELARTMSVYGWHLKYSYIECRDMSNSEIEEFAKILVKR